MEVQSNGGETVSGKTEERQSWQPDKQGEQQGPGGSLQTWQLIRMGEIGEVLSTPQCTSVRQWSQQKKTHLLPFLQD